MEMKKQRNQSKSCFCCSCRHSVSSSEGVEGSNSDQFVPISSLAHAMVQEKLDQMIKERLLRSERRKKRRERVDSSSSGSTKCIVIVAMDKYSYDPKEDFRGSMLEVIMANRIEEPSDLRYLLNCYLSMNSPEYRPIILEIFHERSTEIEEKFQEPLIKKEEEDDAWVAIGAPNLPQAIIEDILCRLPVKSLVRFRCLSKQWETLLTTDSTFIQEHLKRTLESDSNDSFIAGSNNGCIVQNHDEYYNYIVDGDFVNSTKLDALHINGMLFFVGSSNGLICQYVVDRGKDYSVIYFWNPATGECRILPNPHIKPGREHYEYGSTQLGFSFNPRIMEYKVVRIVFTSSYETVTEVYSSITNSWRKLGKLPYYMSDDFSPGVTINGVCHWIATRKKEPYNEFVLACDTSDNTFCEIAAPNSIVMADGNWHLQVFRECLSMFVFEYGGIDVWVMKEYGAEESWTKFFRVTAVTTGFHLHPLKFLKNGELLLDKYTLEHGRSLVSYNPECGTFKTLTNSCTALANPHAHMLFEPYVGSLVPIKMGAHNTDGDDNQM